MAKKIMFSVGEVSADRHGGILAKELKKLSPDLKLFGMGSSKMREAGVDIRYDVTELSSVGVVEYYDFYKDLEKVRDKMIELINDEKPDLIILMDMEGFNIDLAKRIKHLNIPTLYYITPQRWVLRLIDRNFIKDVGKYITKIITMFEDEQKLYEKHNIPASFFGNPVVDSVNITREASELREELNVKKDAVLIGLLPGSRKQEIENLTEIFLKSAKIIKDKVNSHFVIPISHKAYKSYIEDIANKYKTEYNINISVKIGDSHNLMNACDILILSSGSATLEALILEKPMVIAYKISKITFLLGKLLYKYKYIGLPNMLAKKSVVPELLQKDANPEQIALETIKILEDEKRIEKIKNEFKKVKKNIGSKGVVKEVAREIIKLIN
ncbi:MAG: lipid-A-disaccharide synthase [Spirochaetota bacterium]